VDPNHFDADPVPDQTFHSDADPEPDLASALSFAHVEKEFFSFFYSHCFIFFVKYSLALHLVEMDPPKRCPSDRIRIHNTGHVLVE
jgi:hypothetical protein